MSPHQCEGPSLVTVQLVVVGVKYVVGDFVYILNDTATEQQVVAGVQLKRLGYWVAKILEIRASDEHHVYARIYWMYSPEDLPRNAVGGDVVPRGGQYSHSDNELIASNHSKLGRTFSGPYRSNFIADRDPSGHSQRRQCCRKSQHSSRRGV